MSWRALLDELFDADMREHWGWRVPHSHSLAGRVERPVHASARVELEVGGLTVPYFNGWITVDFAAREVICDGVDQKTPADMRWQLKPDESWWVRALACSWPQR